MLAATRSWKRQEGSSPPGPKGALPSRHLRFNPVVPTLDFWLPGLLFYPFVLVTRNWYAVGRATPKLRGSVGNQLSWLGACGLAGAQLTRLGSQGLAPSPLHLPPGIVRWPGGCAPCRKSRGSCVTPEPVGGHFHLRACGNQARRGSRHQVTGPEEPSPPRLGTLVRGQEQGGPGPVRLQAVLCARGAAAGWAHLSVR